MIDLSQLVQHHLKVRLEYRASFLFSLLLHPLVMLLTMLMFKGIYSHHGLESLLGYSLGQMVWYFGASHFFYYLVWNMVDKDISDRVLHGRMDEHLVRPQSMLVWEFAQLVSQKLLSLVFEFIPVFAIYLLIWFPDFLSLRGLSQYLLLTALAMVQFFLISFLLGVLAFRWNDVSAVNVLKFAIINVFAGVSLPIVFFPEPMQALILSLPFHYLFHTPVSHLLGTADVSRWDSFLLTATHQSAWILLLLLLTQLVYAQTIRHFRSAGG
jgi:ABC-2 type transport system permease protein